MMVIAVFILVHWYLSGFCQSFYLHRYASHRMFTMPVFWERFFYLLNLACQGISCMPPRTYAVMHRMHHAYADTPQDPHSPKVHKDPFRMAFNTVAIFFRLFAGSLKSEPRFDRDYPTWPAMDRLVARRSLRLLWGAAMAALFILFYVRFAPSPWYFLLLPVHFYIGLINGTVVNWCGHLYGHRAFESGNSSKNLVSIDFLFIGESLHNNHHSKPWLPNFAVKPFELDPTYQISRFFQAMGILRFNEPSKMR